MNELEIFQKLKNRILDSYRDFYPYFQGDWKSFSSKDIRQLIELIEENQKETVSEKWIYTHLKSEMNEKLPRKDLLDIFSKFVGVSSWEEFAYQERLKTTQPRVSKKSKKNTNKKKFRKRYFFVLLIPIIGFTVYEWAIHLNKKTILIKNELTKQPVQESEVEVYHLTNDYKKKLKLENSRVEIPNTNDKISIESPYFEEQEIQLSSTVEEIYIKPEDYALVLKRFIESDWDDWEVRKEKLNKIFSEDLEVILFLKDELGAEHLNKKEFSEKLILPTQETKKMKILTIETNPNKEITFIRIQKS